jgi:serine protease Do
MEHDDQQIPMPPETHNPVSMRRAPRPNLLGLVVAISIVTGGLAGGVASYALFGNWPGRSLITNSTSIGSVTVQEDSATIDVVKKTDPAVVSIVATKDYQNVYQGQSPFDFGQFFYYGNGQQNQPSSGTQQVCSGTGFVVQKDGVIVTNDHVLCDSQAQYSVVMNDGKKYDAKILATDSVNDVAVLKVEATNLTTVTLGDSSTVQIGQTVIAIGNALGQYQNTVTKGVISAKSRTITASDSAGQAETLENVFQTDASINPGNSGGPLLDLTGAVIGINTAIDSQGQLIGFAIPINVVKKDINSVLTTGKISQPYLGVRFVRVTAAMAQQNKLPVSAGALIQAGTDAKTEPAVIKGSPADKAGLVANDIITKINDVTLSDDHSLTGELAKYQPGDKITVTYYHQGQAKTVSIVLGERPAGQ